MAYRHSSAPEVSGVPSRTDLRLLNGTIPEVVLACSYVTNGVTTPIDLVAEGYNAFSVVFEPAVPGLSGVAAIDGAESHKIRAVFTVQAASAVSEDVETEVSVFASRGAGPTLRTDCVLNGVLTIESSPLPV